uniref:Uncharacterized protein n=1 Tax=Rousettus aegyptiacus TaxID=9407 RepID=A0A7J8ILE3_ROUAE|nr:hypothetical protein HJG63_010621 [Rousettus aegyptiacus]
MRVPFSPHPLQHLLLLVLLIIAILTGVRWYPIAVLISIFLIVSDVENLFMFVGHLYVFWEKCLFRSSAHILIGSFLLLLLLNCMSSLYILDSRPSSEALFANRFSHLDGCLFTSLTIFFFFFFAEQKF